MKRIMYDIRNLNVMDGEEERLMDEESEGWKEDYNLNGVSIEDVSKIEKLLKYIKDGKCKNSKEYYGKFGKISDILVKYVKKDLESEEFECLVDSCKDLINEKDDKNKIELMCNIGWMIESIMDW
jgi:hypothetical protein